MSTTNQDRVRLTPPATGRMLAEDGVIVNQADTTRQSLMGIWRGEYPGAGPFNSHGEVTTSGSVDNYPIWPGGPSIPDPLPSGVAMSVVSSSTADSPGELGAWAIYMEYLDNSLSPRVVVFAPNGTTPVTTPVNDIRWIQTMIVVGANPSGTRAAVGDITASYDGTTYAKIAATNVDQTSSFRMVPSGYKAYVSNVLLSSVSTTADAKALVRTVIWNDGILIPSSGVGTQNNSFTINLVTGSHALLPGMILGLSVTANKALTATGSFIGWVEPYSG